MWVLTVASETTSSLAISVLLWSSARRAISSSVAGAIVHVDGRPVGATPTDASVDPGTHTVQIDHPDYQPNLNFKKAKAEKADKQKKLGL